MGAIQSAELLEIGSKIKLRYYGSKKRMLSNYPFNSERSEFRFKNQKTVEQYPINLVRSEC